ncbi:hypothetical protein BN2127_JRS3_03492 [Bacillus safensis]|uniref:hypothetical protein n=1 Tax=Bacillus safensis TaxID=561879 RepID=UPI0006A8235E|nr:hypothetical protein [Bacillus safensis]CUB23544.1 hypothetical protein BN2127_JRS3_03492 [Bacillus safensis]
MIERKKKLEQIEDYKVVVDDIGQKDKLINLVNEEDKNLYEYIIKLIYKYRLLGDSNDYFRR